MVPPAREVSTPPKFQNSEMIFALTTFSVIAGLLSTIMLHRESGMRVIVIIIVYTSLAAPGKLTHCLKNPK